MYYYNGQFLHGNGHETGYFTAVNGGEIINPYGQLTGYSVGIYGQIYGPDARPTGYKIGVTGHLVNAKGLPTIQAPFLIGLN